MSDDPEVKYKGLITGGIIVSGLLFVGILVTIITAKQKSRSQDDTNKIMAQMLADSILMADSMAQAQAYDDYYSDPGDYYVQGPVPIATENDSLLKIIRSGYPGTYKTQLLDHLEEKSEYCAKLLRELQSDLGDTISQPGVSGAAVSIEFFSRTERDEALFSALFEYRETTEDLAGDAGIYDITSYRDYLPLRERSVYGYIKSWDESEFEKDPIDVLSYLKNMEMDVRYYENQILWDMVY